MSAAWDSTGHGRCDFCGRVHEGCYGHRDARKFPCGRQVVPGKNFCRKHFALMLARNKPRLFSEELKDVAAPLPFLQETVAEIVAFKELAAEKLAALQAEQWRFTDDKGSEQLRSEVAIFERAMDRCVKWLHALATIHLEERLVRIEEQKADLVVRAFTEALGAAHIPEEQVGVIALDFRQRVRQQAG